MVALPRHTLQGPTPGTPYYLRANHTDQSLVHNMPFQLVQSLLAGAVGATDAWAPTRHPTLQSAIQALLDFLGSVLQPVCRLKAPLPAVHGQADIPSNDIELPGHLAFAEPIGLQPQLDMCMLPDAASVSRTKHIAFDRHGYLLVKIARRPKPRGGWVAERAHRLVLWAMWGPPPVGLLRPVCMHVCHNCSCLNPDHMVWGEDFQNKSKLADVFANQQLNNQGRVSFNL